MKKSKIIPQLRQKYENSCNSWLVELLNMWEMSALDGYWVSDEVGGVFILGDDVYLNMDDIIYCVENAITYEEYTEWQNYCLWAYEFQQNRPNLESWHMGCPRVDEEGRKKLTDMKKELENTIIKLREKTNRNGNN